MSANKDGDLTAQLIVRMEQCPTAEALNDQVINPFAEALTAVCRARGYLLNIYGDATNIAVTSEPDDADAIYRLIEAYLDTKN